MRDLLLLACCRLLLRKRLFAYAIQSPQRVGSKSGPALPSEPGHIILDMKLVLPGLFTKDLRLFALLEGAAEEAHTAVARLSAMLSAPEGEHSRDVCVMEQLRNARSREKAFAHDLKHYLSKTMMTPLDREDIEALSNALYKIPKTATKFGDHYIIAGEHTCGVDVSRHVGLLAKAAELVRVMVRELRQGANIEKVKTQKEELGRIEGEADRLMLAVLHELYSGEREAVQVLVLRDLFELLEKVYDRCLDAGNVVFRIALKQS